MSQLNRYLDFLKNMNNNYVETINDEQYNKFIWGIVDDEFKYGRNKKEIKSSLKATNEFKPSENLINKNVNLDTLFNFESKPKKDVIKKKIDLNKIEHLNINHKQVYGGDNVEEDQWHVDFFVGKTIPLLDMFMTYESYRIDFNEILSEKNKQTEIDISEFIKEMLINEMAELMFYLFYKYTHIEKKYKIDIDIIETTTKEQLIKIFDDNIIDLFRTRKIVIEAEKNFYGYVLVNVVIKNIAYILMYITTRYLSTYKNFDTNEYKQRAYLFFRIFYEFHDYFDMFLKHDNLCNNWSIIPYPTNVNKDFTKYDTLMNKNGGCAYISGVDLINMLCGNKIQTFADKEITHIFKSPFSEIHKTKNLSKFLFNVLCQFIFWRYTLWIYRSNAVNYDEILDIALIRTFKTDNNGDYIFGTNLAEQEYSYELNGTAEQYFVVLTKTNEKNTEHITSDYTTSDYIGAYTLFSNGCNAYLYYSKDVTLQCHAISMYYIVKDGSFKILDPNQDEYIDKEIKLIFDRQHKTCTLRIEVESNIGQKYSNLQKIVLLPFYGNFIYNSNFFKKDEINYITYKLNSDSYPLVEKNTNIFNYNISESKEQFNDFINKTNLLYLDHNKKMVLYVGSDDKMYGFSISHFFEIISQLSNITIPSQRLDIFDNKTNRIFLMIATPYYYIDLKDVKRCSNEFIIYTFNENSCEFVKETEISKMKFNKFAIKPYFKKWGNKIDFRSQLDQVRENMKLKGGIISKNMNSSLFELLIFVLIISVVIVVVIIVDKLCVKRFNNKQKDRILK